MRTCPNCRRLTEERIGDCARCRAFRKRFRLGDGADDEATRRRRSEFYFLYELQLKQLMREGAI